MRSALRRRPSTTSTSTPPRRTSASVFDRRQHRVSMTIADDGIGLVASSSIPRDARRGLGLLGMRERAALIGGELTITAVPGAGTSVTLMLPAA